MSRKTEHCFAIIFLRVRVTELFYEVRAEKVTGSALIRRLSTAVTHPHRKTQKNKRRPDQKHKNDFR